jgi:hypothetical protein
MGPSGFSGILGSWDRPWAASVLADPILKPNPMPGWRNTAPPRSVHFLSRRIERARVARFLVGSDHCEKRCGSNDDASPLAVRRNGKGSPFASVNSCAASQQAMMALVRDGVAGVSLTGAPAPRSLATPCD